MPTAAKTPKFVISLDSTGRYEWTAILIDLSTIDKPKPAAIEIAGKSLAELLTKVSVAVVLRDQQNGAKPAPPANGDPHHVILTPNRRIVT